ncbi:MAG: hypothetical protein KIT56_10200 [Gammaproteobacteria bacterium]|nr:hypothetical protein [Gammaproteobacteria bacterium]MCW5584220.1 hypothetical protein [Gammaproteobacteria bacterium]
MKVKKIVYSSFLAACMSSVPFIAQASLTIVNNTDQDSTSIINNGICSDSLPGGVTKAHSPNVISDVIIGLACLGHPSNCQADVYMTNNCNKEGAAKVATVLFDTKAGIKNISMNSTTYKITGSGFNVQLNYNN